MSKRRFLVSGTIEIDIEFDDDLMPDDEWREVFYPITTIEELAVHLAWNLGVNRWRLSELDGFADREDKDARLIGVDVCLWETQETIERNKVNDRILPST